ncbi:MAG TPA: hypothetical protein PKY82_32215, partial [Pyrinomonadaceae bacterium]|nr:hypothetical protein [Pyrinomonadaceae bacterium]
EIAVTRNFNRYFGAKFSQSGVYSNPEIAGPGLTINAKNHAYTFAGGVQIKDNSSKSRIQPFAHALFGITTGKTKLDYVPCPPNFNDCSVSQKKNNFTMIFGGGIDVKANKNISIRPIQIDYVRGSKELNTFITKSAVRLGAGIVFTKGEVEIPVNPRAKDYSKYEFHVGYSYNKRSLGGSQAFGNIYQTGLQGYNSSIKWNFQRFFGAEFEHSAGWTGTEKADDPTTPGATIQVKRSLYTYAGGIQVKDNSTKTRLKPFGHFLLGGATEGQKGAIGNGSVSFYAVNKRTDFVMIFGGGLDVKVNDKFSVRVFQFDHLRSRAVFSTNNNPEYIKYYRFGAGIVFH